MPKDHPLYRLTALTVAHANVDAYANVIGPLMILFAASGVFSAENVKLLPAVGAIAGSLMQPLVGMLADRGMPRGLLLAGPAFAASGVALAMLAGHPVLVVAFLVVSGLGVAAFHPEAAVLAPIGIRRHPTVAMSVFLSAGAVGLWLGPLACGFLLDRASPAAAAGLLALPGLLLGLYLARSSIARTHPEVIVSEDPAPRPSTRLAADPENPAELPFNWPLASLTAQSTLRSVAAGAVAVVVPWWGSEHGATLSQIGNLSGLFLFSGGIGMLLASWLCRPRWQVHLLVLSSLLAIPPVALLAYAETIGQAAACVLVGGIFTNGANAVIVSMAQRSAPRGQRTASALTMGLAAGLGGAGGPLLAWAAQSNAVTLWISAAALVPAGVLAVLLPPLASIGQPSRMLEPAAE